MPEKTPESIAAAASDAAAGAYSNELAKRVEKPSWLPDFLAFDLDRDGIPDVLEPHLWSDAMATLLWAISTFAPADSQAAKVAARVEEARQKAMNAGVLPR